MKIAVITGASSGLGKEYLKHIAGEYPEIEEIWIIARRSERLKALAAEYPAGKVVAIPLDLTDTDSFGTLASRLEAEKPEIGILVNNAGFGVHGAFDKAELDSQSHMIDLNCRALTAVTRVCLPYMKKSGFIVNVCSIASFAPNAFMAVYCSTKAYVMSFSGALRYELKERGINVLAVCPGPMSTEFLSVAGIEKGTSHAFDTLPRCNPDKVALISLKKAKKGNAVYTPTAFFKFYRLIAKLLPHALVIRLAKT